MVNTLFISEVVRVLQKGLTEKEAFEVVLDLLAKTIPYDSATLYLYNSVDDRLEVIYQRGAEPVDLISEVAFDRGFGLSSWISKRTEPIVLPSLTRSRPGREARFNSFLSMPLNSSGRLLGVLNLGHLEAEFYRREEQQSYQTVASHIAMILDKFLLQLQLDEQNKKLRETLAQLQAAQRELIEKERLSAIGEIVVAVNHEINNPLTSIIGLAEILELAFEAGRHDKIRDGLKGILKQAKRIQRVTQQLTQLNSSESTTYIGATRMTKLSFNNSGSDD